MNKSLKLYKDSSFFAGKTVILIYFFALLASYLYVQFTETFNGDFIGKDVYLDSSVLFLNFFVNIIPIFFLWKVYVHYKKKQVKEKIYEPQESGLYFITLTLLFIHIFMTGVLNVGVMAGETYQVNSPLKFVIQILYRFQPQVWAFLFILETSNNRKVFIVMLLLFLLSILKHSMGGIWLPSLVLFVKYYDNIKRVIKKNKLYFISFVIVFPFVVQGLYVFRNMLRGGEVEHLKESGVVDLLAGRLAGRLSCYSNTTYMFQEIEYFFVSSLYLDNNYFIKQVGRVLLGVGSSEKELTPEKIMISITGYDEDAVSFMTGVFGNSIMAMMKSPYLFLLNISLMIFMVLGSFKIFSFVRLKYTPELSLILCVTPIVSGVSSEFAFVLFTSIVLYFGYSIIKRCKVN